MLFSLVATVMQRNKRYLFITIINPLLCLKVSQQIRFLGIQGFRDDFGFYFHGLIGQSDDHTGFKQAPKLSQICSKQKAKSAIITQNVNCKHPSQFRLTSRFNFDLQYLLFFSCEMRDYCLHFGLTRFTFSFTCK